MKEQQERSAEPTGAQKPGPGSPTGTLEDNPQNASGTPRVSAQTAAVQQVGAPGSGTSKARRSGRISKEIPILLLGSGADGRTFSEDTHTVILSLHGAGIVSRHRLIPEQELILRWKEAGREADVRVVGEIAQEGDVHTYGVAFVNDKLDFWKMEFPPVLERSERPLVLQLECVGCHDGLELLNGDFEFDICMIHGGLTRYCSECGLLTVWKRSQDAMPSLRLGKKRRARPEETRHEWRRENGEEELGATFADILGAPVASGQIGTAELGTEGEKYGSVPASGQAKDPPLPGNGKWRIENGKEDRNELSSSARQHGSLRSSGQAKDPSLQNAGEATEEPILPIAVPAAAKEADRRARARAKVNFFACVRSQKFGEDIVACIDMGRGGVSFRTRNRYEKESMIQIAVPFAAEERQAPAIFVQGRIANVTPVDGGMYRCGVEFLR